MEVALEMEDDLFFADLSRQLSLLLMDDNEFPAPQKNVSFQAVQPAWPVPPYTGATCKGTGVFIPRSLLPQPPRKPRRGRYNAKQNRQLPVLIDVNSDVSSDHLFHPRKG